MLYDKERVGKYSEAIRRVVKEGDIVADIGTGTGLLAFLCVKAGAKRVHAIERSSAIKWAKRLAKKNGFGDRIIFHEEDSRSCNLNEKANVVISELIGHIAFEEGMAESLFDAKERFLVPDGVMVPQIIQLKVALVEEKEVYPECIDCWESIEGIDYSLMRKEAVKACYLTELGSQNLLSEPQTFFTTDFRRNERMDLLEGSQSFRVCRAGEVNGIALWFDAYLTPDVLLSSGPRRRTHWRQCFGPIGKPKEVKAGDELWVHIEIQLRSKEKDFFNFVFQIEGVD